MWSPRKAIALGDDIAPEHRLTPSLSWPHLIALGVDAIVGTGILTLTGVGAAKAGRPQGGARGAAEQRCRRTRALNSRHASHQLSSLPVEAGKAEGRNVADTADARELLARARSG